MKISIQIENFELLEEAVQSSCDNIRFGSEFCEYKMPTLDMLERAYELVHGVEKRFTYVTPRLSNDGIERMRKQLAFLNENADVTIVFNDFGLLNIIANYPNLRPHLGRQLFRVPVRSPWPIDRIIEENLGSLRWYSKVLSSISLNYPLTIELLKTYGIEGADVDCIPRIFPSFTSLMKKGLDLSVLLHMVPIMLTRRCHTARFIGEKSPEHCSKPCLDNTFLLRNENYGLEFFLYGNVVLDFVQLNREILKKMERINIAELVVSMNSVTGIVTKQKIDDFISRSIKGSHP